LGEDNIWFQLHELGCVGPNAVEVSSAPAILNLHIAAVCPAQLLKPLQKCFDVALRFGITFGVRHQHADAPHPVVLLRARR
jgi:hypothetical protein